MHQGAHKRRLREAGQFAGTARAGTDSPQARPALSVQSALGNQAVRRLLRAGAGSPPHGSGAGAADAVAPDAGRSSTALPPVTLQKKLTIGAPQDVHEQEADLVAGQVMHAPGPEAKRDCEGRARLQPMRTLDSGDAGGEAPPIVHEVLSSPGHPLEPGARASMEARFGHSFDGVRVHTDARAAESAEAVNASAYTVGQHIVFGAGQYLNGTPGSQHLLAHELTHVVQQGGVSDAGAPVQRSGAIIQRAPPQTGAAPQQPAPQQPAPTQPAPKIKFQFGFLVEEDVETNQQVAAIARLMIISLQEGLADVRAETVKTQVNDWIDTVKKALPYFDQHAGEKVDPAMIPFINYQYDKLLEVQDAVRQDKMIQIKEALWREHEAAVKAAEEAEAMQPAIDDALRATYRKGSSSALKKVVSTAKSSINIGRNIRALAAGITTEIMGLPLASGTKVYVDHWTSQIGRPKITIVNINKYTESLNKLGRGLSAVNAVLTAADRSKKATEVEQGMKDISDAFNIGTDLISASPWGAPPHFSLYSTLYVKPALEIINWQIGMLMEYRSASNRDFVGLTGQLQYPEAEPGGKKHAQEILDLMVEVMHAKSEADVPALPSGMQEYLFEYREKLGIGAEADVPTKGSLWWKGLDADAGRKWLFANRKRVWAMFYGSWEVPPAKR